MKEIVFVIGAPNTGKSFFIKHHLTDYQVVDLFDFQKRDDNPTVESIINSYNECEMALRLACKRHEKVVLEHTLMKSKRRFQFVNAVKETLGDSVKIKCYYTMPSIENYCKYDKANLEEFLKEHPDKFAREETKERLQYMLDNFEIPTKEDGFSEIEKIG